MREITLYPGESLTVDGLTVKSENRPGIERALDIATICSTEKEFSPMVDAYAYYPATDSFSSGQEPKEAIHA